MLAKKYKDHLGNEFPSLKAMADYWNIPDSTLHNRLYNLKLPIEQALTLTNEEVSSLRRACKDHLGNVYESKKAMCEAYNIDRQVFFGRMGMGWSLEDALTKPIDMQPKNSKEITDHMGNTFKSISEMCRYWNMTRQTYVARMKNGWTMEKALTVPQKVINNTEKQEWTDHLGNKYPSLNAMCEAYGITHYTFNSRVRHLGWSVEKALTEPTVINSTECTDRMGHTFPTISDMCHYYGLRSSRLQSMKNRNLTDEELMKILTSRFKVNTKIGDITIKEKIEFPYYLVMIGNQKIVMTFEQLLDAFHNDNFCPIPKNKVKDKHLVIKNLIKFPYYEIEYDGKKLVWTYWQIIQYRHDSNFGLSEPKKILNRTGETEN